MTNVNPLDRINDYIKSSTGIFDFSNTFNMPNSVFSMPFGFSTASMDMFSMSSMPMFQNSYLPNSAFMMSQIPVFNGFMNNSWNTFMPFGFGMQNFNMSNNINNNSKTGSYSYDESTVNKLESKWKPYTDKHGLGHDFFQKVVGIANKVKCNPNSLLCLINSESSFKYKQKSGLYGNIYKDLTNVSWQQQLDMLADSLIEKRNKYYGNRSISDGELYAMNFLPARIKGAMADSKHILTKSGEKFYSSNAALDKEKKGYITIEDMAQRIRDKDIDNERKARGKKA